MASQRMALVQADGRLSAFWPFFKRSLGRGSIVASMQHIHRYVSEYVFRYNYSGREGLMFRQTLSAHSGSANVRSNAIGPISRQS